MNLSPTAQKFVLHWGEMGTRWGVNRTVAQIHALLYLAEEALTADDIVDTLGVAQNHKVLTGIGAGCDEEALRVARSIPHEWIPGRKAGRAVPVEYELPFVFRIAKQ